MAENAGHLVVFSVSPDGTTYTELTGITSCSIGQDRDMLEITSLKDTTAAKVRLAGLRDAKVSMTGNYDPTDASQIQLTTRYGDGASAWIGVKWDGSGGTLKEGEFKVASFNVSVDVGGTVEFTCDLVQSPSVAGAGYVFG